MSHGHRGEEVRSSLETGLGGGLVIFIELNGSRRRLEGPLWESQGSRQTARPPGLLDSSRGPAGVAYCAFCSGTNEGVFKRFSSNPSPPP